MVTIQQTDATGLMGEGGTVGILHLGLATGTTLRLDFDDTVGTLRTIDGSTCRIFQHGNGGDVVGVHVEEFSKLVFCGIGIVEVAVVVALEDVAIHHDEGL